MAPALERVAAVPLVDEPRTRLTCRRASAASTQSSEVLLRCLKSEALSPGGPHGSQPSGSACLALDGFERRILRAPHRLLDLLYWVV
jgi:hypothetical protein